MAKFLGFTGYVIYVSVNLIMNNLYSVPSYEVDKYSTTTEPSDWERSEALPLSEYQSTKPLVVVAGLSRTGTSSMKVALEHLNLTTHHTYETMTHYVDFWFYYLNGKLDRPDVRKLIEPYGVDVVSDSWFGVLLPEILHAYPRSKVILTTRDAGKWITSCTRYIENSELHDYEHHKHTLARSRLCRILKCSGNIKLPLLVNIWSSIDKVLFGTTTPNSLWLISKQKHESYVRSIVPRHRLLEFDVERGDGWNKLVRFLGHPYHQLLRTCLRGRKFPRVNCVQDGTCISSSFEPN